MRFSKALFPAMLLLSQLAAAGDSVGQTGHVAGDGAPASTTVTKAEQAEYERNKALQISQAAIGRQIQDYRFFDSQGNTVNLSWYRGKPLVISMIYTSCFHVCPTTTRHLHKVVKKAESALGKNSFNVITIGFDAANDTADAMRDYANQQDVNETNWSFLAANAATISKLADDIGFLYSPSPKGFEHLVQNTILDSEGVVYRQVYGIEFDTPHFIEPLKQLIFGEPSAQSSVLDGLSSRIRLFCTVYDPASDSYRFDYSIFVGLAMGLVMGAFMVFLLIKEWRYSKAAGKFNNRHGDNNS